MTHPETRAHAAGDRARVARRARRRHRRGRARAAVPPLSRPRRLRLVARRSRTRSLTHMIAEAGLDIPIFTLDTGRLFPETYDLIDRTGKRYGLTHPHVLPGRRRGREDGRPRRRQPLPRQHRGAPALLRGAQDPAAAARAARARRLGLRPAQRPGRDPPEGRGRRVGRPRRHGQDQPAGGLGRGSACGTTCAQHDVPYNPLHDQGFPSIGCAPCTRAVAEGEDCARRSLVVGEPPSTASAGCTTAAPAQPLETAQPGS